MHPVQSVLHWPVCLVCMHCYIKHRVYTVPSGQLLSQPYHFHRHCMCCRHQLLSRWLHCSHWVQHLLRWKLCLSRVHYHSRSYVLSLCRRNLVLDHDQFPQLHHVWHLLRWSIRVKRLHGNSQYLVHPMPRRQLLSQSCHFHRHLVWLWAVLSCRLH